MKSRLFLLLTLVFGTFGAWVTTAQGAGPALYPDLQTTKPSGLYFDAVTMSDGLLHYVLRFSNTVWNSGQGRLELQGDPNPSGNDRIYQNFYDAGVGGALALQRQVSSDIIYHPTHYHYHFENFASYLLLKRDAAGVYQATTKKGTKTSFCIIDYVRMTTAGPTGVQYGSCSGTYQGLSVGWGDTYVSSLPEQWVDLGTTRLVDGYYALQSTADPANKLDEAGRDGNNVGITYFSVQGGVITIGSAPTTAACGLSAVSGIVGSTTNVTCSGFAAGETVRIYWDSTATTPLASTTASSSGSAAATITIPDATRGGHSVIAVGASSGRRATAAFTVYPRLIRTPVQGPVGTSVAVTVKGFGANESVKLTWETATGATLGTATTNSVGTGTVGITIPTASNGWHDYTGLGLTTGARAWGAINVLASLGLSPTTAAPGSSITASLKGYPAGAATTVYWNRTASSAGTAVCSGTTSTSGTFTCGFAVPAGATGGTTYPVVGVSGAVTAQSSLAVTAVATATATATNTPVPPTNTPTNTPVPPTNTPTNTPIPPTSTPTPMDTPVPTETPIPLPPAAPTDLTGTVKGAGIRLTWTDKASSEDGYTVYRSVDGGQSFQPLTILAPDAKSYRDVEAASGETYTYYVTANSAVAGDSVPSNWVTVTEN